MVIGFRRLPKLCSGHPAAEGRWSQNPATHRPAKKEECDVSFAHRLWVAIAALCVLFASLAASAQDTIVAKVNGKTITEADMKLAEAEIGSDLGTLPAATKRRVLVEFLIENQLFADAAEGQQLASGAAFNERLQYWRRRALRDAYFDTTVRNAINDADAKKLYDGLVGTAKPEEEVRARHILVESKDKARDLYEKLAHGSDFAQLAKEHSKDPGSKDQGGELGFFTRGQMVPQFEEAAFKLKKGEIGEPFQSQFGWHIVRVDDRHDPQEGATDRRGLEGKGSDRVHRSRDQERHGQRARWGAPEAIGATTGLSA
jgi:peptidyl-prolyl cis-trans isomerase C